MCFIKKYRKIKSKKEAEEFQKTVYGEYCKEYIRKRNVMRRHQYEIEFDGVHSPIEVYLGNMYRELNSYMRGLCKVEPSVEQSNRYKILIDKINEEIMCAPVLPEDIVLYRGTDDDGIAFIKQQLKSGDGYMELGFLSTSLLMESVIEQHPTLDKILMINVKKGANVLGVDNIVNRSEYELLFPSKQTLIYKGKEWKKGHWIYKFDMYGNPLIET